MYCVMLLLVPLQDMLDCTTGDGCLGQFQTAYADMLGCVGVALEHDAPYRVSDSEFPFLFVCGMLL